jgi:hypothetical protein
LEYKKPMDVYQESIKLNQEKKRFASNILDREFTAPTPNSKWVSDTTLLPQNL